MIELNGTKIEPTVFPDGTSQVWKLDPALLDRRDCEIYWTYEEERELIQLCQLTDLLKSLNKRYYLELDYLPYGRQDKPISNDQTFALYTFARIINSCDFYRVTFLDAHSAEAEKLINKSSDLPPLVEIRTAIKDIEDCLVAYPDKGAFDRYSKHFGILSVIGHKVREESTGYISHYYTEGVKPEGRNVLIVDDICDGGMTFKLLARDLLKAGAKSVHLYVTHGIFSKGLETLRDSGIERIFTHEGEVK